MRILDTYINKSIYSIFLITILIFCLMYLLIDVTSQLDEFIDRKVSMPVLVQYYLAFFPVILVQISSVACLIAALLAYSGLSHTNEIVAMRSCGMSFWQITKPAVYFAILMSILTFFLNEEYIPQAMEITKKIRNKHMVLEVDRLLKQKEKIKNLTFYGLKNRLFFIDAFDPQTNELHGVTIIEHDENQNVKQKIVSLDGTWTGMAWQFTQCQMTTFDPEDIATPVKIKVYEEKLMDIKESPEDFLRQRLNVSAMDSHELKHYIKRFANSGAVKALNNLHVDWHHKLAYPIRNLVIILIGLPFVLILKNRKGIAVTSIGIALMIGFLYYVTEAIMLALGKGGAMPPILAAWGTPLIFTTIALVVIERNF